MDSGMGLDKARGMMFGLAIGDALAAPTEFMDVEAIVRRYGADGPHEPKGDPARVTDDTQMALAVGRALLSLEEVGVSASGAADAFRREFLVWDADPENNRAPGRTCLTACDRLRSKWMPWQEATVTDSKGCGANMRVMPVALMAGRGVSDETVRALAQLQAGMTHGHATGLAASELTVFCIQRLAAGATVKELLDQIGDYIESQQKVYHEKWLGNLWQRPMLSGSEQYIKRGWYECEEVYYRLVAAVKKGDRGSDPCEATGDGWVAEDAWGTGLLCALLFFDEPVKAIRRAAVTSGDSDSIACLAGAFVGARHGISAWPADWVERIEYREQLEQVAGIADKTFKEI
jgi:ADP-ribosylglycohydrolase